MPSSMQNAESPDAYVAALTGWQRDLVLSLRRAVKRTAGLEERIKWGHLVYLANGPVLLIRSEKERVLFGFWRGRRLCDIEPRLKPGGKYEMATLVLTPTTSIEPRVARRLVEAAAALNVTHGDPTDLKSGRNKPRPVAKNKTPKKRSKPGTA